MTAFGRVQPVTRKKDERLVYLAFQPVGSSELQWRLLTRSGRGAI